MRESNLVEVVVLGHHWQAVHDRRSRNEGIGELDSAVQARTAAVDDQPRPPAHHRFSECYQSLQDRLQARLIADATGTAAESGTV